MKWRAVGFGSLGLSSLSGAVGGGPPHNPLCEPTTRANPTTLPLMRRCCGTLLFIDSFFTNSKRELPPPLGFPRSISLNSSNLIMGSLNRHQSVHLPQIQIKLTHCFVFVYNSWLAAYTVIISFQFHSSTKHKFIVDSFIEMKSIIFELLKREWS